MAGVALALSHLVMAVLEAAIQSLHATGVQRVDWMAGSEPGHDELWKIAESEPGHDELWKIAESKPGQ